MLNVILDTRLLLFYYILYKYFFSFYKTINLIYFNQNFMFHK